jgi:3-oxoacid CoA-transferase B subunit
MSAKARIAARAAAEIRPGEVVNLGIGLPTLLTGYIPEEYGVVFQSENGILGMGGQSTLDSADPMCIDAGGRYVETRPGASFFDSALSFAIIRGGRLDVAVLGALEVAGNGDLANWIIPGKFAPGIGGGMELAQKARRVLVVTTHCTSKGRPKILEDCTLPLTARACVRTIVTELAVLDVMNGRLVLRELACDADLDDVLAKTSAPVEVPPGNIPRFGREEP